MAFTDADRGLYMLLHSRYRARWLDPVMVWFTKAGTKGVLWLGIAGGLLFDGSGHARRAAVLSICALLLAEAAINLALKPAIRRERPYSQPGLTRLLVRAPGPHSWPSAHAGSSVAAATVLTWLYGLKGIPFLLAAAFVSYSRVYVGVHYPFDVAAGILIGVASAAIILVIAGALPM